jgi:hypothetical protein
MGWWQTAGRYHLSIVKQWQPWFFMSPNLHHHIGDMCSNAINLISCEEGITWWSHYGHSVIVIDHHRSTKPGVIRCCGLSAQSVRNIQVQQNPIPHWKGFWTLGEGSERQSTLYEVALLFVCELALDQNIWYQKCFPLSHQPTFSWYMMFIPKKYGKWPITQGSI